MPPDERNQRAREAMQRFRSATERQDWRSALREWRNIVAYIESVRSPDADALAMYRQVLKGLEQKVPDGDWP